MGLGAHRQATAWAPLSCLHWQESRSPEDQSLCPWDVDWHRMRGVWGGEVGPPSVPCDQSCWDTDGVCLGVTRTTTRVWLAVRGPCLCKCQSRDVPRNSGLCGLEPAKALQALETHWKLTVVSLHGHHMPSTQAALALQCPGQGATMSCWPPQMFPVYVSSPEPPVAVGHTSSRLILV